MTSTFNARNLIRSTFGIFVLFPLITVASAAELSQLSQKDALQKSSAEFQNGSYSQALETLRLTRVDGPDGLAVLYWRGVNESKLQDFSAAAPDLQIVVRRDSKNEFLDSAYLMGQALYATQDFRHAREYFQLSAKRNYKPGTSLYYVGYIDSLLGDSAEALKTFQRVLTMKDSDPAMQQPAAFQMGEVYYASAKRSPYKSQQVSILSTLALPAYEKAIDLDRESPMSVQAQARVSEINKTLGLEIPRTRSGVARPAKVWVIRLTEDFKYDSNIINQSDDKLIKVSNTGAPLTRSALYGKYEYLVSNWIALTPELSSDYSYHLRRIPEVYSNDNLNLAPALRTRLDHRLNNKPAAGLIEYEFGYSLRDYAAKKSLQYYIKTNNVVLGERAEIFGSGSTTFKFNYKFSENVDSNQNYTAPGVSLGQNWRVGQYILNTTIGFENQTANSSFYNQRNYKLSASYGLPNFYWDTNVDFLFNALLVDTENQSVTRGKELNLNPGVLFTKFLDHESRWAVNFSYNFTNNSSNDKANYAYKKHVVGLGAQYTF